MILSSEVARGIADGSISLVFRRWRRPDVAEGSTLRTVAGVVVVDSVIAIEETDVSDEEAAAAGAISPAELLSSLRTGSDLTLYRIAVHWHGPDPRDALSAAAELSAEQVEEIRRRLETLDRRSSHGAWTHATLRQVAESPERPARELAELLGRNKDPLKLDIRKLKNLGLTHSLDVGYRISPRGAAYLAAVDGP